MRNLRTLVALVALLALAAPAAAYAADPAGLARLRTTHRISASVEFVDRWTISSPRTCDYAGPGTLTVRAQTAVTPRVKPLRARFSDGSLSSWMILVPYFSNARHLPPMRSTATITREDNTTQNPPSDVIDSCLNPKTGCGAKPARDAQIAVGGRDRRYIDVDLSVRNNYQTHDGSCQSGFVPNWHYSPFFGRANSRLRVRMPSPSALRRRVVRVSGSDHKSRRDGEDPVFTTDDVTRKATVTFRRR